MNKQAALWEPSPNNLEPFWMGFTPNRAFKRRPRMVGRAILDGSARLFVLQRHHDFLQRE